MHNPGPQPDRLIGTAELATLLGCHEVTIYKWIGHTRYCDPNFPQPIRGLGQRLKWWESKVLAYIASCEAADANNKEQDDDRRGS